MDTDTAAGMDTGTAADTVTEDTDTGMDTGMDRRRFT